MEQKKKTFVKTEDESVVVGRNPVMELLKSDRDVEKLYIQRGEREGSVTKIFALAKQKNIVISEVDKKRLDELACGNAHQGVAAIASAVTYKTVEEIVAIAEENNEKPLIVVCDGRRDRRNTLVRVSAGKLVKSLLVHLGDHDIFLFCQSKNFGYGAFPFSALNI